jgi:hypothetical protein
VRAAFPEPLAAKSAPVSVEENFVS